MVARQPQSPRVGGAEKGLPRDGKVQQQPSLLAVFMCEQLLDFFNFRAKLRLRERERESITLGG